MARRVGSAIARKVSMRAVTALPEHIMHDLCVKARLSSSGLPRAGEAKGGAGDAT